MWLRTTNGQRVNGADNEHEDKKGIDSRGETIRKDQEGVAIGPNRKGEAY